jgi:serine/threonine protein kinase HipA of HipAB toxin-antitoxin module
MTAAELRELLRCEEALADVVAELEFDATRNQYWTPERSVLAGAAQRAYDRRRAILVAIAERQAPRPTQTTERSTE